MQDYLAYSQQIREEILTRGDLLGKIKEHWQGQTRPDTLELIDTGSKNKIYGVGRLESGLWVALREPIRADEHTDFRLENYCHTAEQYQAKGKRVSRFCVAIQDSHPHLALLVEDLTEGGRRVLISDGGALESAHFQDNPAEKVFVDLDFDTYASKPKFLEFDRMINLL